MIIPVLLLPVVAIACFIFFIILLFFCMIGFLTGIAAICLFLLLLTGLVSIGCWINNIYEKLKNNS